MTPQQRAYRLLGILESYADTEHRRLTFMYIYNRAVMEEVPYEDIARAFANLLSEGLNCGNWPWASWTHGPDDQSVIEANAKSKEGLAKMSNIIRQVRYTRPTSHN